MLLSYSISVDVIRSPKRGRTNCPYHSKIALSLSYYAKNLFASSYGKDVPTFFIWHPEGTSKSVKKLLFKIDFFILTYGCLAYFTKWLDQANLSNAYVSGIIGPIPANLLLTWIPLELIWAILTIGTFAVKKRATFSSVNQLYPIRFIVGFLEGSSFVGIQYVLGSWYKKTEIGKRTAIFACAAYAGTMISGYIQSALLASLDGRNGVAAWRWVYIIDGLITFVVAIYGVIFFPDTPYNTKAFYFNEEEKARCVERLEDGREETTKFSWDLFTRTLKSWQLYVLTLLWMFWNTTVGKVANTVMQLYLKNDPEHSWTLYEVNNIPSAINGWNNVMVLLLNVYIDTTGCRMNAVALNLLILLFGTICLVIWDIPLGLRVVAYMLAGLNGPLSPIYYSWAIILTAGDAQVRALTLAIMNSRGAALITIIQQFLYPVTDAPVYSKGFKASLGFLCGMCIWVVVVRVFEMRAKYKKRVVLEADSGSIDHTELEASGIAVIDDKKV
ncbi:Uu.00g041710.m01.CDS01 [Anthostomella pinea]|uniref:Uu.00g041710.m01.CDS01 n=1 Tax=Anthostomella pinea TaxID=933095 RepID=A0AAI8YE68_9PEZI|nr:Uu.00g041710.m01.CDS01 [Anthostomella pinea]